MRRFLGVRPAISSDGWPRSCPRVGSPRCKRLRRCFPNAAFSLRDRNEIMTNSYPREYLCFAVSLELKVGKRRFVLQLFIYFLFYCQSLHIVNHVRVICHPSSVQSSIRRQIHRLAVENKCRLLSWISLSQIYVANWLLTDTSIRFPGGYACY